MAFVQVLENLNQCIWVNPPKKGAELGKRVGFGFGIRKTKNS